MIQTYTLFTGEKVMARPGQIIHCDCRGRFLRIEDRLTNGLGMNFKCRANGTLERYIF